MKFILLTYSAAGHVNPMQSLAKALVERGHEVSWLTGYDSEKKVVRSGARFFRLKALEPLDEKLRTENTDPMVPKILVLGLIKERTIAQVSDLREILENFKADCIINELNSSGPQCLHELGEVPTYASLGVLPLWQAGPDLPPALEGRHPPTTFFGRIANKLRLLFQGLVLFPCFVYPIVQEQRNQLGLPPLPTSVLLDKVIRSDQLHIQTSCPSLEYFHDETAYPQVHFVGPFIPPDPAGGAFDNFPSWWPEVETHPCVIHVTQGTYTMNPFSLILPAILALRDDPSLLVVVTSPHEAAVREQLGGELPANVRMTPFLPYDRVFAHARLVVTNGGYGGVKQALMNDLPVVCAGQTEDKQDVAARVSWNGVGIDLKTDNPSPKQVAAAVKRVLADGSFKENAKRIGAELRGLGGVDKACDLLEALVKTREVVRRTEPLPPSPVIVKQAGAKGVLASRGVSGKAQNGHVNGNITITTTHVN